MGETNGQARIELMQPLTRAALHIALALAGGEMHGYGIMLEVDGLSGGNYRLGPGTLYRSIQRMVSDGLIEEADPGASEDERRRNYRLTPFGRKVVRAEVHRLESLVEAARSRGLLDDGKE